MTKYISFVWFLFVGLANRTLATVACSGCRAVELQNAPGIGIELSLGHATAAIKFLNGTLIDVAHIEGTSAYLAAMQQLAEDAAKYGPRSKRTFTADSSIFQQPLEPAQGIFPKISQVAKTMMDRVLRPIKLATTTGLEHVVTHAVADMLISVKETIECMHSIQHETIYLVVPNSISNLKFEHWFWFKSAAEMANLPIFSHHFQSTQAAMKEFYGIGNCPDIPVDWYTSIPDLLCEEYNGRRIRTVLSIDYSTSNLNLMLLPREEGFFFPDLSTVVEHFDLGAASVLRKDHPDGYWAEVKEVLSAIVRTTNHSIDLLTLQGDQATDPKFLSTVEEVFRLNGEIRKEDYLKTSTDHLFASARAAAREARIGMLTGFDSCVGGDWCPQGEEDIPDGYKWIMVEPDVTN